ncbi:MAG TPA: DUF2281 domain-containing protein [Pirellulales bacterium]|jgi:antitoxin (DNA-binding transcriptional repressor) of toxin-antitoxin stability system|nr:DUF2281 domain-containing protein [Pirellulales bacterium]
MATVNVDEMRARLPEIISELSPGEHLVILDKGQPVATLTRHRSNQWPCKAGSAKNTKHWMASDFDAPIEDFREYSQ